MKKVFYKSKTVWGILGFLASYYLGEQDSMMLFAGLIAYGFRDALK